MFQKILAFFLLLPASLARADQTYAHEHKDVRAALCEAMLMLETFAAAPEQMDGLQLIFHFTNTLPLARYETEKIRDFYILHENFDGWHKRRGPHDTPVRLSFTPKTLKSILDEATRRETSVTEVIRILMEIENNFVFPLPDRSVVRSRVPKIAEGLRILAIADRLETTPEEIFTDFGERMKEMDETRLDYAYSSIAEVLDQLERDLADQGF